MFERFNFTELRSIAASGGGFTLDASKFTFEEVRSIAATAAKTRAQITVVNTDHLEFTLVRSIAAAGSGSIIFAG